MGATAHRFTAALRRPGPLREITVVGATALGGIVLALGYARKFGHLPGVAWWRWSLFSWSAPHACWLAGGRR
jgi:hypothetical protein